MDVRQITHCKRPSEKSLLYLERSVAPKNGVQWNYLPLLLHSGHIPAMCTSFLVVRTGRGKGEEHKRSDFLAHYQKFRSLRIMYAVGWIPSPGAIQAGCESGDDRLCRLDRTVPEGDPSTGDRCWDISHPTTGSFTGNRTTWLRYATTISGNLDKQQQVKKNSYVLFCFCFIFLCGKYLHW